MIIQLNKLSFSYGKTPVLQDLTLSIQEGEFVGIFGPNGGGKTTFLQLLMGFLKPSAGMVTLFNKKPKEGRSLIGYVPQASLYDPQFPISTLELVLMGLLSHSSSLGRLPKWAKERALEALDKVGLRGKEESAFGTLSGGQAQRALIARALVSRPKLLLLDEPTANIDSNTEAKLHELLLALKGEITILMVTHDLKMLYQSVDRWLCIHREVDSYLPHEVCHHFSHGLYHHPTLPVI